MPFAHDEGQNAVSPQAIAEPPIFEKMRAVMSYGSSARQLVSSLKFRDRTDLAPWMARWMAARGQDCLAEAELIVPVPLHWTRLLTRQYNQSAELGRGLSALTGVPFAPQVLFRHRRTRRQLGLGSRERANNVQGAFRVPPTMKAEVQHKTVVLVDDVYTSGATVEACARALERAGADSVRVLVFALVANHSI